MRIALAALVFASGCALLRSGPPAGTAFDFPAETLDGEPAPIAGPGPARLVDVWATWCEPCARSAPVVDRVLARHPGVVGIALSVDDGRAGLAAFAAKHPRAARVLHWPGGIDAASKQGVSRIPLFVAVDARGRVVGSITGDGDGLEGALDRLVRAAE